MGATEFGDIRMAKYEPGDYVKAEFHDEHTGQSEWMWVKVDHADDLQQLVFGRLDNEPIVNTDLRLGTELAVSFDKIREHMRSSAFNQ
jgi:uncharacterized protein YegJ (DUF2314 family)